MTSSTRDSGSNFQIPPSPSSSHSTNEAGSSAISRWKSGAAKDFAEAWRIAEFEFRERCHRSSELCRALEQAGLVLEEVCDAAEDLDLEDQVGRAFYLVRRP